jgi:MYXO-CTERM domain-containing protein
VDAAVDAPADVNLAGPDLGPKTDVALDVVARLDSGFAPDGGIIVGRDASLDLGARSDAGTTVDAGVVAIRDASPDEQVDTRPIFYGETGQWMPDLGQVGPPRDGATETMSDGGSKLGDAAAKSDAGGSKAASSEGCSCRVGDHASPGQSVWLALAGLALLLVRRRRR